MSLLGIENTYSLQITVIADSKIIYGRKPSKNRTVWRIKARKVAATN